MANKFKGLNSDYDSLQELSKQKHNHTSIQVTYKDDNKNKTYFWEYLYENKYTRYTVCESIEDTVDISEIDLDSLDLVFDEGLDLDFGLTEQPSLTDAWNASNKSTGFEQQNDFDDPYDPNSALSESDEQKQDEVEVNYIEDTEIADKIVCMKKAQYNNDIIIKDRGRVIYDEYIYSPTDNNPNGLEMIKKVIGDQDTVYMTDDLFNKLVRFQSSKGVRKLDTRNSLIESTYMTVTSYINDNGETLEESCDYKGNTVRQVYINKKEGITITAVYLMGGKFLDQPKTFGNKELNTEYSEYKLTLDSKSQSSKKQKFRYKQNRKCLYIPKIEFFKNFMNLSYIEKSNYQIIDDKNKLIDIVDMLLEKYPNKDHVIGYDAETQGLRFHRWVKDPHQMVTHSLSWEDHQSIIIPLRMKYCKNINPIEAAEILRPILEVFPILAHNGAADVRFNWCRDKKERININLQEDTMHLIKHIMPFACHKEVLGYGRAIDDLIHQTFRNPETGETVDMIDLHKYVYKTSDVNFDFALLNEVYMIYYGCPDTDLMRMLWKVLRPKLNDTTQLLAYKNTVLFSKNVAINSSYGGLGVDEASIKHEKDSAQAILTTLEGIMYKITGETKQTLSFTSAPQKTNYIFNKMGAPLEYARTTSEGKLSADKVVINRLAALQAPQPTNTFQQDITDETGNVIVSKDELNRLQFPFCRLLRIHGDLTKNITAFYNGILNNSVDGAYYGDYRIGATDTWRTTDRIQITKKNVKHYLGPINHEEWGWFSVDYAAEEFRLTVNGSDDHALKVMLTDPESDPHTMVTSELYGIPPYKVSGDLRKKTKSANFGIIYGMKARALSTSIFNVDVPTDDQLRQAQELYDLYCYKRALMLKPLQKAKSQVAENGWQINHLGYKMVYHQIVDVKDFQKQVYSCNPEDMHEPTPHIDMEQKKKRLGALLNACGNYPIQSWAAGILMVVYNKICKQLEEDNLSDDVVIPLQVHDEVGGYFKLDKVHPYYLIKLFNDCMVSKLEYLNKDDTAPLYIGVGFGKDWGDAKDDNKELPVALQLKLIEEYKNGTAPTIEAINQEGIYNHFDRRIAEYMKERLRSIFHDMTEAKHYNRQEMQHRLNTNMFVGKKVDELFKTNDKKTKEIKIDRYMELILDMPFEDALAQGYTWEEGEPVVDDSEREPTPDELREFFFSNVEHPRMTIEETAVAFNLKGVSTDIANNAIAYIKSLCNNKEDIHNKSVIIQLDKQNIFFPEDQKIIGIPDNFDTKFNAILNGNKITITYNKDLNCPIVDVEETPFRISPVKRTADSPISHNFIIDVDILNKYNTYLFNGIMYILNSSKRLLTQNNRPQYSYATIQISVFYQNNLTPTEYRAAIIDQNTLSILNNLFNLALILYNKQDPTTFAQQTGLLQGGWIDYLKGGIVQNE